MNEVKKENIFTKAWNWWGDNMWKVIAAEVAVITFGAIVHTRNTADENNEMLNKLCDKLLSENK